MRPIIQKESTKRASTQAYGMAVVIVQSTILRETPPHNVLAPTIRISDIRSDNKEILKGTPRDMQRLRDVMEEIDILLKNEFEESHI